MSGISKGKARKARERQTAKLAEMAAERAAAERRALAATIMEASAGAPSTPMAAAMLAAAER